jgi:phage head maturation protease
MSMTDDFLVAAGSTLKSISDSGKVGGYLVLFDAVDKDQEFFTRSTDFWLENKSSLPLIYDHGRSPTFGRKKLTNVMVETQDAGVWIEGKLPIRESAKIEGLWEDVKADRLGLSSGTSGHLAERVKRAHATEITLWPISEASLALMPAQPKSRAVALKSLAAAEFELSQRWGSLSPEEQSLNLRAEFERLRFLQITRDCKPSSLVEEDKAEMQKIYAAMARFER